MYMKLYAGEQVMVCSVGICRFMVVFYCPLPHPRLHGGIRSIRPTPTDCWRTQSPPDPAMARFQAAFWSDAWPGKRSGQALLSLARPCHATPNHGGPAQNPTHTLVGVCGEITPDGATRPLSPPLLQPVSHYVCWTFRRQGLNPTHSHLSRGAECTQPYEFSFP